MVYVVSGYANLHKTHVDRVGYNLCDPTPHDSKGFNINCSLVCSLGQPFISGMASFFTYREECDGNLIGTRLLAPNMFFVPIGCPSNLDEDSPYNNTWAGSTNVTTSHGVTDEGVAGYRLKIDAVMTAISPGLLSLSITTSRLMPDSLTYVVCNAITMAMTETPASVASDGYDARYYESELLSTSFDQDKCGGEVKKVRATVALLSYHFGCSVEYKESADKCNLRTRRGAYICEYSCLVGLVRPSNGDSWSPQVVQFGVNHPGCEVANNCNCLFLGSLGDIYLEGHAAAFKYVGCPNESSSNAQRIQSAYIGYTGFGTYQVVLKTINLGAICVAARFMGIMPGPWIIGSLTTIKSVNPFIMKASFSGLFGNPEILLYGMEFPTAVVQDCIDSVTSITGPPPMEPHEALGLQIIAAPVTQGEAVAPQPPPQSLEMAKAREMIRKIYDVKARPCVNLGMALEKTPSCGCGGAVLHECSKHGQCRQSGNDPKAKLCWKCDDYLAK